MNKTRLAISVVILAAVVGGTVVAVSATGIGPFASDNGFERPELASFETTGPACVGPWADNSSTVSQPAEGGTRLIINETIPVASRNTTLDPSFDDLGPGRYHLDVERRHSAGSADCRLAMRYNATLNLTESNGYTVVITYDGQLKQVQWSEPNAAGVSKQVGVPDPRYAPNRTDDGSGTAGGGSAGGAGGSG